MSVIHVGHIKNSIEARFGSLVDLADVATAQTEQRDSVRLTRNLAAFVLAELGSLDDSRGPRRHLREQDHSIGGSV
jgi:hypothetical protein